MSDSQFEFKTDVDPVFTTEPFYDLCEKYIKPRDILAREDEAQEVIDAVETIQAFLQEAEDAGAIEVG